MPLDAKQIEEWKRLADFEQQEGLDRRELRELAREAVPGLIAEVEQLRVLLRELEWPGNCGDCHFCDGHAPSEGEVAGTVVPSDDGRPWRVGHAPDCRLAAFLNG